MACRVYGGVVEVRRARGDVVLVVYLSRPRDWFPFDWPKLERFWTTNSSVRELMNGLLIPVSVSATPLIWGAYMRWNMHLARSCGRSHAATDQLIWNLVPAMPLLYKFLTLRVLAWLFVGFLPDFACDF